MKYRCFCLDIRYGFQNDSLHSNVIAKDTLRLVFSFSNSFLEKNRLKVH